MHIMCIFGSLGYKSGPIADLKWGIVHKLSFLNTKINVYNPSSSSCPFFLFRKKRILTTFPCLFFLRASNVTRQALVSASLATLSSQNGGSGTACGAAMRHSKYRSSTPELFGGFQTAWPSTIQFLRRLSRVIVLAVMT